jgi:hypothetical protein
MIFGKDSILALGNMKKPRTGRAGLLGFHWGEPVMAREAITPHLFITAAGRKDDPPAIRSAYRSPSLLAFIQPTVVVVVVEPRAIAAGTIADDAGGDPNTAAPITITVAATIITVALTVAVVLAAAIMAIAATAIMAIAATAIMAITAAAIMATSATTATHGMTAASATHTVASAAAAPASTGVRIVYERRGDGHGKGKRHCCYTQRLT